MLTLVFWNSRPISDNPFVVFSLCPIIEWSLNIPSNKHSLIAMKEQEVGISCGPTLLRGQFNNTLQVMVL